MSSKLSVSLSLAALFWSSESELLLATKPTLINQILISVGLFLVRLIVRIAGAQGLFGYAATHEWVYGVFEYLVSLLKSDVAYLSHSSPLGRQTTPQLSLPSWTQEQSRRRLCPSSSGEKVQFLLG